MRILVVDDSSNRQELLGKVYSQHSVTISSTADEAVKHLKRDQYDVIHLDYDLDKNGNGQDVARFIAGVAHNPLVLVHSENPVSVHIANMNALTDDAILILGGEGAGINRRWRQPREIGRQSSAEFCRDCAEGVGWVLSSRLSDGQISQWWTKRLTLRSGRDNKRPPGDRR